MAELKVSDRRVHAYGNGWELARYDRPGTWYVEWTGNGPPAKEDMSRLYALTSVFINSNNRARVYARQWVSVVSSLGLTPKLGLPGGEVFDRAIDRHNATKTGDDDGEV